MILKTLGLNEATASETTYTDLFKEQVIEAAHNLIGPNNLVDGFILAGKDGNMWKVSANGRLNTILKKHVTDEETGEISPADNAKKCVKKVAEVVLEVLFRVGQETSNLTDEIAQYKEKCTKPYYHGVYLFKDFNYYVYSKLPATLAQLEAEIDAVKLKQKEAEKAKRKAERDERAADIEIKSKETIKNDFNSWVESTMLSDGYSPVLDWLYYSITDISANYPPSTLETYVETWEPLLEDAGLDPDLVRLSAEGRWGFAMLMRVSEIALKQLIEEAEKSSEAKFVLDKITAVETLKRIGKETWQKKPALAGAKITGNYWTIALIKRLNELADDKGGYPFNFGENKNKDLKFTFIDEPEEE